MIRPLDPDNFVADKLAWHQQIAMDPKLSMSAKAVAGLILHDLNGDRGGAWRGQKSMAACLGVCERQLRRLLNELAKSFYLQIEGANGRGRTNIYRATRPDQEDIAALQPAESRTPVTAQARKSRHRRPVKVQKAGHPRHQNRTPVADNTFMTPLDLSARQRSSWIPVIIKR